MLRLPQRRLFDVPGADDLRKLPTARGAFILRWRPSELKFLLRSEDLAPSDLAIGGAASTGALARELFLLGLQDEMAEGAPPGGDRSPISAFARELLGLIRDGRDTRRR